MKLLLTLAFAFATVSGAQTARVIVLTPDEAKQASDLYAQRAEIDAKIGQFKDALAQKYIITPCKDTSLSLCIVYDPSWLPGFEFSTDFKAIFPTQPALRWTPPPSSSDSVVWLSTGAFK